MIVVDASALAPAFGLDEPAGWEIGERIADERVFAPEFVDLEVTSYVRRAARIGLLTPRRALQALEMLALAPIARVSHTPYLTRIWDLRDNLTPYDAAYVALAETLDAPLLTADARLANAPGVQCEVQLVG